MKDKSTKVLIIELVSFFLVMGVITLITLPYIRSLYDTETQLEFKTWIDSIGFFGWIIVLLIQIVQVVIAFIPGEPVEILTGVLYGGIIGMIICLIGCAIASIFVFMISKKFGTPLIETLFGKKKLEKFHFLNDSKKMNIVVFILFLIPGTPKDMLTYVVGTTDMKASRFITISTIARMPSIITSTFIGATLISGNWIITVIIFAFTALMGIFGVIYKDKIIQFCKHFSRKRKNYD